jgi:hypothetical protein
VARQRVRKRRRAALAHHVAREEHPRGLKLGFRFYTNALYVDMLLTLGSEECGLLEDWPSDEQVLRGFFLFFPVLRFFSIAFGL